MKTTLSNSHKITIGSRFYYEGKQWRVVALDGSAAKVRDSCGGLSLVGFSELIQHADFNTAELEDEANEEYGSGEEENESTNLKSVVLPSGLLDATASTPAKEKAATKANAVNLLLTGFSDGVTNSDAAPDPNFGPQNGQPLKQRVQALALARNISVSTIWRWIRSARENGNESLIDKRTLTGKGPLGNCPQEVLEAMIQVASSQTNKSKVADKNLIIQVTNIVKAQYGDSVPIPAASTFRKYFREMKQKYGLHLATKTRQGNALRPEKIGPPIVTSYPFELVEIDSTPLDVFAISGRDGKPVRVVLTLAIDVFSRSLVAWQFSPFSDKAIDAALLLHDMITPKAWQPAWGPEARWRYGIPENLVIPRSSEPLAGIPIGKPSTLSLDNGKIYTSNAMRSACLRLGISLHYSRVRRPTDKPHIERVFGTIRTGFVENLPGYKGPRVDYRGTIQEVENRASLLIGEIEELFAQWVATSYQNTPHKGLINIAMPKLLISPNEAFDAGVAIAGYIPIVTDVSLAISLLPATARKIGTTGIELNGLMYDSPVLDAFRKRTSPFADIKGSWPIRFDPRDLSTLWFWEGDFQDQKTGQWVRIPARIARTVGSFADVHLAYAKSLFSQEDHQKTREEQSEAIEATMIAMFARVNAEGPASPQEARSFRLGTERTNLAIKAFPHETETSKTDGYDGLHVVEDIHNSTWDFDFDDIEPFRMATDNNNEIIEDES
jgi:transposase InsO family protein